MQEQQKDQMLIIERIMSTELIASTARNILRMLKNQSLAVTFVKNVKAIQSHYRKNYGNFCRNYCKR